MMLLEILKGAHARISLGWSAGLSWGPEGATFACGGCLRVHAATRGECPPADLEATHWTLEDALWSASGGGQRGLEVKRLLLPLIAPGRTFRHLAAFFPEDPEGAAEWEEAVVDHLLREWSAAKDCKAALGMLELAFSRARAIDRAG
jgi:hypothetical protein